MNRKASSHQGLSSPSDHLRELPTRRRDTTDPGRPRQLCKSSPTRRASAQPPPQLSRRASFIPWVSRFTASTAKPVGVGPACLSGGKLRSHTQARLQRAARKIRFCLGVQKPPSKCSGQTSHPIQGSLAPSSRESRLRGERQGSEGLPAQGHPRSAAALPRGAS